MKEHEHTQVLPKPQTKVPPPHASQLFMCHGTIMQPITLCPRNQSPLMQAVAEVVSSRASIA